MFHANFHGDFFNLAKIASQPRPARVLLGGPGCAARALGRLRRLCQPLPRSGSFPLCFLSFRSSLSILVT